MERKSESGGQAQPAWRRRLVKWALLGLGLSALAPAWAARITAVSPQGEVAQVQQLRLQFSEDVVPAGDPRQAAPFVLRCNGRTPPGDARWLSGREWVYELKQTLPAGSRCTIEPDAAFQPPGGAWQGPSRFAFSTGAPVVLSVLPHAGARIEEDQHFLLRLNGAATPDSVRRSAWCEVDGIGERIPVRVVEGAPREQLLRTQRRRVQPGEPQHQLLLACQRPLPADTGVRLVWGPGIAAAGQPQLLSRRTQRFAWQVRPRFLAEFSCERENALSPCLPLRPVLLRFNAPVARELALAARLQPAQGAAIAPQDSGSDASPMLAEIRFSAPLPENTRFTLTLPPGVVDDAGRALANAGAFPLAVATGPMPPLARFAAAPFGIVEAGSGTSEPALLPLTLRHVQADIRGASTGGEVRIKHLGPEAADAELLRWLGRLQADHRTQFKSREVSLLADEAAAQRLTLPVAGPSPASATEVIGIPLPQRGYHVVEVQSRVLGQALLASRAPMYARTGVLVSNLAVHFKRGRSSSLVWVSSLDRGRPVAGAQVAINDCSGQPLWHGRTDAAGLARVERGFDDAEGPDRCATSDGLFVTARSAGDLGFVFGRWQRGIEAWRFNLPLAQGTRPDRRAHTVLDRELLRVGESVGMKHFVRDDTAGGLALPTQETLPNELLITHVGSGTEHRLPLQWAESARAAESRWNVPRNAALGLYELALLQGEQRLPSGSLRIEAFRVPLVDARLSAPANTGVAPGELVFLAQLGAMAGGPLPDTPLTLSALLRPAWPRFAGYEEFRFEPPRTPQPEAPSEAPADEEDGGDGARLVADRIAARTDAQGAARLVVPALPTLNGPAELQAELSFADPAGEVQTVSQRLRLWPAAVVAGLRLPDWAAARGQARFTALVLDTTGRPQAGREVQVRGRWQRTFSVRKRVVGGFYAYDNRTQTRDLGVLCSGRTDSRGELQCSAKSEVQGEVELIVRALDDAGRASEAAASVWMSGDDETWFAQGNDDRIELLPEQREVEPGQTARLQLRMPFRRATALLTVEREGILEARVLQLSGREPVIELPIPPAHAGAPSWAPNVVVSVLVLRGRLREAPWWSLFTWGWREPRQWWQALRHEAPDWQAPTAMVDLAKPAFKLGVAQLKVGLAAHRLDVQVSTGKTTYRVRETVRTRVRVSQRGQPVPGAQVAFAAVDEGLLALQDNRSWDLLGAMLQPRPWGVETATAASEVIGRRHHGRKALPPGGGGGHNPTRELFDTLLLWRGTVALDARGEAMIEVPLNDSLTRFRLVAVADAGADRFGSGSASVSVSQELQMLPGLAPLAREGDRFDAGFTLRNTTPRSMNVNATLAAQVEGGNGTAAALPPQRVTLAAGAATELRWPFEVPAGATRIVWTGTASGDSGSTHDQVRVEQSVLPAVPQRVWQSTLQPLERELSLPLAPPAGALPGRTETVAVLQARLSGALPGLRRFFETYAYSCVEQQASRALALRDNAAWATLREELPGYLDADGLAHPFPPAPGSAALGSDRLTAYLVASAHAAGRDWPEASLQSMLGGLAAFVEGRIERHFNAPRPDLDMRKLSALEALSRHGRASPRQLESISFTPAAWPTSALLDAWSLLQRLPPHAGRDARLDQVQRLLRSRLIAGGTTLRFSTEEQDHWWWLMESADANAARLLLAAVDAPGWQADLPRLLVGTLARQRQGAWLTTTANLWGVLALERFAARHESAAVSGHSTLQLGAQTTRHDWAVAPEGGTLRWSGPAAAAELKANHAGEGRPWLQTLTLAAVPLQAPMAAGYRVHKTLLPLQRKHPDRWSRGDTLRVRLQVEAVGDMAWVVVQDPIPAGATLLGSGLGRDSALATRGEQRSGNAWLAYEERGADAWRGYLPWLPRGTQVLEYTLRLNNAGRFVLPPTRVEAMYAPETFGEWPNAAFEVSP